MGMLTSLGCFFTGPWSVRSVSAGCAEEYEGNQYQPASGDKKDPSVVCLAAAMHPLRDELGVLLLVEFGKQRLLCRRQFFLGGPGQNDALYIRFMPEREGMEFAQEVGVAFELLDLCVVLGDESLHTHIALFDLPELKAALVVVADLRIDEY